MIYHPMLLPPVCHRHRVRLLACTCAVQKATVKEQLEQEVQRTANDDEKYRQMLGDYRAKIEQVRPAPWLCKMIYSAH